MADDQKPKTMDIDDLVRELSKSSTSSVTPPPAPQTQAPRPPFPASPSMGSGLSVKPPMPPPAGRPSPVFPPQPKPLETPKPKLNVPPSPPTSPLPTPGVKEYQSSIRTMNEDIAKIKQGQQPMGVPVPRKVEQVVPVPSPTVPKSAMLSQQFKVPSVNLGEAQKTGPLAQSKSFSKPVPMTPPPAPVKPKTESKPQIYVPEAGQKGGNRNMLFMGIGAVAIVAGFVYWFFVLRSPAPPVAVETPTSTPSETSVPTPTPTLTSIFSGVQKQSISIKPTNSLAFFVSDVVGKVVVDPGAFKMLEAADAQTPSVSYGFSDLVAKLSLKIPGELTSNFGNDSAMFAYGQKESFDSKGNTQVGVLAPNKLVIIAELKTPSGAAQAAVTWETTMSSDLKTLFSLGAANKNQPGFLDNAYRTTSIRYRNFPYADKTIDYAIVSAHNSRTYLVVADSREAVFAAIDKLLNF